MQKIAGYTLYGSANEQFAFFLVGTGANGKTVFIETIKKVLGRYACIIDKSILTSTNKKTDKEKEKLIGTRMAILNEIEDGLAIKLDIFKRLTGQDTISIAPYNKEIEFQNKAKLFIISNSLPNFGNSTDAAWRRVKILPFNEHFDIESRNIFLQEDLAEELEGIFNWMLEGYNMWLTDKHLKAPQSLDEITKEYKILADPLGGYFYKCLFGEEYSCRVEELYYHYKNFCEVNEIKPVSKNKFGTIMSAKGIERYRDNYGIRCYKGIKQNYGMIMAQ